MQWKFQREYHNLQDKAHKRDYREDFIAESQLKSSPIYLEHFKSILAHGKVRMERNTEILACKEQLILRYLDGVFCFGGRDYQFRWSLKDYIKHNQIVEHFSRTYTHHRKMASQDLKAIEKAIRGAVARWRDSKAGKRNLEIFFTVAIQCDRVTPHRFPDDFIDARTLFKRAV
ncbi:MAG: hypothetical protein MUF81_06500 [Verrucomicrobia bacterium]|jgi:hypothetical protein|nr:hypothetical protein [Verrucomicrobiota bacterium]